MGSGLGKAEGPQGALTQSRPLSDELSKASGHSFTQQTFIETQDKGSSVQSLWFSLKSPWEDGEGLINGRLSRRPPGGGAFQGLSPAHQPKLSSLAQALRAPQGISRIQEESIIYEFM